MYALRLFVLAALALLCSAIANDTPRACVASYGTANGGVQPCSPVSVFWMKGLARNCTNGDLTGAYTAMAKYCEDTRRENASLEHSQMNRNLENVPSDHASRIVMRRPSADSEESKVEPQQWQSSSSSSKHHSWAWKTPGPDGFSLSNIFAERSVRFALSGLLFTTLTSFLFL